MKNLTVRIFELSFINYYWWGWFMKAFQIYGPLHYFLQGLFNEVWKALVSRLISLRWDVCAHKASLTPPLFTGECICALGVSVLPLSAIFLCDFKTVFFLSYSLYIINVLLLQLENIQQHSDSKDFENPQLCNHQLQ